MKQTTQEIINDARKRMNGMSEAERQLHYDHGMRLIYAGAEIDKLQQDILARTDRANTAEKLLKEIQESNAKLRAERIESQRNFKDELAKKEYLLSRVKFLESEVKDLEEKSKNRESLYFQGQQQAAQVADNAMTIAGALRDKIGNPPKDSPPEEMNPRASTWHEERANWASEVNSLRKYISVLEKKKASKLLKFWKWITLQTPTNELPN
jgi:chromosome segregation ATPase